MSVTSPFARQCRIVVRERRLEQQLTEQAIAADPQLDAEYLAANPAGHGPVLVCDGGLALLGAPLICSFLDTLGTAPRLSPTDGADGWRARRRQGLADAATELAVRLKHEQARPASERSRHWMRAWRAGLERTLDQLEADAPATTPLGVAAIATAVAVCYLDHRHPAIDWRSTRPTLAELLRTLQGRPSFEATAPI